MLWSEGQKSYEISWVNFGWCDLDPKEHSTSEHFDTGFRGNTFPSVSFVHITGIIIISTDIHRRGLCAERTGLNNPFLLDRICSSSSSTPGPDLRTQR